MYRSNLGGSQLYSSHAQEIASDCFLRRSKWSYILFEAVQFTGKHITKCSFLVSSSTTVLHSVVTLPYPEFLHDVSLLLDIFVSTSKEQ